MGINLNPFTWWTGASWGTAFGLRGKARVGEDALGNVYYEGGRDTAGNPRRWVIYNGPNDSSRVAPEWFSWLHHQGALEKGGVRAPATGDYEAWTPDA